MARRLVQVREGCYLGPGGCSLTIRCQPDGGCILLVQVSRTSAMGWAFGPKGLMQSIVAESRRRHPNGP